MPCLTVAELAARSAAEPDAIDVDGEGSGEPCWWSSGIAKMRMRGSAEVQVGCTKMVLILIENTQALALSSAEGTDYP